MTNEDQELQARIARLEKELAEVKRLVTARSVEAESARPPIIVKPTFDEASAQRETQPAPRFVPRESDSPSLSDTRSLLHPDPAKASEPKTSQVHQQHRPQSRPQLRAQPQPGTLSRSEPSRPAFDMEMLLGGQFMAFAGASVVIIGMIFAVTYMISKGMISPQLQWGGEIALCAILAGLGIWKIDEKEGFGQVLVGTGTASCYLSFAGAHFYKGIIPYEAVIAAFTFLSVGCFGFSEWRGSKPFFVFGLTGGLIAASLGLESHPDLVPALHGLALAPAALIIIRRRWLDMAYLVWPSTLVFGLVNYSYLSDHVWFANFVRKEAAPPDALRSLSYWAIFSVYGLAATLAYLKAHEDSSQEGGPLIAWFGPSAACLAPFAVLSPQLATPIGFFLVLALAAAHWAVARFSESPAAREGQRLGALIAGLFVPAFALTFDVALAVYAGEALVLAIYSLKSDDKTHQALANCLAAACGVGSLYGLALALNPSWHKPWTELAWALDSFPALLSATAMVVLGLKTNLFPGQTVRWIWYGGGAALLAMRSIISILLWIGLAQLDAFAFAGAAILVVATVVAWVKGSNESASAAILASLVTLLASILMPLAPELGGGSEVAVLSIALAGIVLFGASYARHKGGQLSLAATGSSLAAIYPFARLAFVAAASLGADSSSAVLIGLALFGLICTGLARALDLPELTAMGVLYGCAATAPYFGLQGQTSEAASKMNRPAEVIGLLMLAGAAGAVWSHLHKAHPESRMAASMLGSLVIGAPVVKAASLIMTMPEIGMPFWRSLIFACAAWSILMNSASSSLKNKGLSWTGLIYFGAAGMVSLPDRIEVLAKSIPWATGSTSQIASLSVLLASSLLTARAFMRSGEALDRDWTLGASVIVNWLIASGLLGEIAQLPVFGLSLTASLTGAWVLYGTVILVLGFIKDWAVLRIGGLVVFSAALVKVFFYDLAFLETIIKIFLLIGFGIVMLALSYAYVRFARSHRPSDQS